MTRSTLPSRNDVLEFARRTRTNLECIEKSFRKHEDGHVVTQLVASLLGLIVFPREKRFDEQVRELKLASIVEQGWPRWEISKGDCETLGELVRHLRNAVAHGRMRFTSDSRNIEEVAIEVEDCKKQEVPYWRATIKAPDLREFCLKYIDLLEETVG